MRHSEPLSLLLLPLLGASACTTPNLTEQIAVAERTLATYVVSKNDSVRAVAVSGEAPGDVMRGAQHLVQFAHHVRVGVNDPTRVRRFVVAFNAYEPYDVPRPGQVKMRADAPQTVQIFDDDKLRATEVIAPEFTGSASYRWLQAAAIGAGEAECLVILANSFITRPMWVGVFGSDGTVMYRAVLPHGAYRFTEYNDGFAMIDRHGSGIRLVMHEPRVSH